MKTQYFLSALLVLFVSFTIQAQTIDPESEWRVDYQYAAPDLVFNNIYRDFIDGDTIINSIEYHKIYFSGYSYYGFFPLGDLYYFDHLLHGFLREEDNKWYTFYENNDALLFDFTMNVNDTVFSCYTSTMGEAIIVDSVDSILVDGTYRRRLHLYADFGTVDDYIIEGIGATSGLFENIYMFEWYSNLICFAKDGVSVWGESTEECDLAVNINENQGNTDPCKVFPNPAKDFTLLTIPSGLKNVTFKLIDLVGGIVYQKSLESPSTNKILLNAYHSGVYLAVIESNSLKQSVKLILK
jgi:hypothetical protein